jgi:hypothetical protein
MTGGNACRAPAARGMAGMTSRQAGAAVVLSLLVLVPAGSG